MKVGISIKQLMSVLLMVVCCSCNNSISNHKAYMIYMADKGNGLIKDKSIGGIKLRVKYLPVDYLVYNSIENIESARVTMIDSIKKSFNNSITFMLTIGPDENESFDITKVGVSDYKQFAQRVEEMSFNMAEYITLTIKDKEYKPDLAQMENINGPEQSRNIILVFKAKDENNKEVMTDDMYFTFNDELFATGINKFKFQMDDILSVPKLKY